MAVRRERERRAVLAEAVAEMRQRGKPECELVDLFMDFKGIQVTVAKMAQALIAGRVDRKTAGRLVVQLQMASKLLWMLHRKRREGNHISPQICADEPRLTKEKASTPKGTKGHERSAKTRIVAAGKSFGNMNSAGNAQIVVIEIRERADIQVARTNGPPEWARAA
jgi:hypothetical protein